MPLTAPSHATARHAAESGAAQHDSSLASYPRSPSMARSSPTAPHRHKAMPPSCIEIREKWEDKVFEPMNNYNYKLK